MCTHMHVQTTNSSTHYISNPGAGGHKHSIIAAHVIFTYIWIRCMLYVISRDTRDLWKRRSLKLAAASAACTHSTEQNLLVMHVCLGYCQTSSCYCHSFSEAFQQHSSAGVQYSIGAVPHSTPGSASSRASLALMTLSLSSFSLVNLPSKMVSMLAASSGRRSP